MTHDPIHKFIKRDHWHGVILEPQTLVFNKYLTDLYANQDDIEVVNAALGAKDGEAKVSCIGFSDARWAKGLASFDRAFLEKSFASGHVQRQGTKQGIVVPKEKDQWIKEIKVPVLSVENLIRKFEINRFDLLQIDAEGYDFEIIKLFDF